MTVFYAPHGIDEHSFDDVRHVLPRFQFSIDHHVFWKGSYGAEFYPPVRLQAGDVVLSPHRGFDSFVGTDLEPQLTQHEIEKVVLAGFTSQTCVEGTGRHALEAGYHVTLLHDAVAEFTEQAHRAALDLPLRRSRGETGPSSMLSASRRLVHLFHNTRPHDNPPFHELPCITPEMMMNDLLDRVLVAHGGMDRWSQIDRVHAEVTLHGPFWAMRGFSDKPFRERLTVDPRRELIRFSPWAHPEHDMLLRAEDDRVELLAAGDDTVLESRSGIRSTYGGYDLTSPWDSLQVGYFIGYAMWNYLTTPFLFTYPGVSSREVEPWAERGEVWRRLHVVFPRDLATHSAEQTFYFGDDGLLRRLDYNVDVNVGVAVAQYVGDYQEFDGIQVPTRRRVHRRNPDNSAGEKWSIGVDIENMRTT